MHPAESFFLAILGGAAEIHTRRAVIMQGYSKFFTRPASLILILLSIASLALPFIQARKGKRKETAT